MASGANKFTWLVRTFHLRDPVSANIVLFRLSVYTVFIKKVKRPSSEIIYIFHKSFYDLNTFYCTKEIYMDIMTRLHELGIKLPPAPKPVAAYRPWLLVGDLIHISGQLSKYQDTLMTGKLGEGLSREQGKTAAQYCIVNVLAQLNAACRGDLSHVVRAVRLNGYINATSAFREHPHVMDGASEILTAIWGEAGEHVRTTIGCQSLPMQATMEIDAVFQIRI